MFSEKICIFFVHGISGGTATLSYRLASAYIEKGYLVYYICEERNSEKNIQLFEESGIDVIVTKRKRWNDIAKEKVVSAKEVLAFSYSYELFIYAENVKKHNSCTRSFLYVVYERCLFRGGEQENGFTRFINRLNRRYIYHINRNNHLLFMENRIIDVTEKFLNIDLSVSRNNIFPLPYQFMEENPIYDNRKKTIVTMSRLDFPFKGYLMGLIDDFTKMSEDIDDLELWIIGTGNSAEQLKDKLNKLDKDIKNKILLLGELPYDNAKEIIAKAFVFVGLGTGLLDAVSKKVPAIGTKVYEYKCLGNGFLYEHVSELGFLSGDSNVHDIIYELETVFNMSQKDYIDLCEKEYCAAISYYGMDQFINKIEQIEQKSFRTPIFGTLGYKINQIAGDTNLIIRKIGRKKHGA